jgi:hypothetical protein
MDSGTWIGLAQVVAAAVTAVATYALYRVTRVLADETRRLADIGKQPHVVAVLVPSARALTFIDVVVENTGSATAYNIEIDFAPEMKLISDDRSFPLQRISVLPPGQKLTSLLTKFGNIRFQKYDVRISWSRQPSSDLREENYYTIDAHSF